MPICAVARLGVGQLRKRPESKPGTAILDSPRAGVYIVDEFRFVTFASLTAPFIRFPEFASVP